MSFCRKVKKWTEELIPLLKGYKTFFKNAGQETLKKNNMPRKLGANIVCLQVGKDLLKAEN